MSQVSPVKNTSGGGYAFEDRVGAWLAAALLAGKAPVDAALGPPVRIDFQVGVDGWHLDDVLVTFASGGGRRRLTASIKSGAQFSPTAAPAGFVARCWQQLSEDASGPFNPELDLLGLICAPIGRDTYADLQELVRLAAEQEPDELAQRIEAGGYISEARRELWSSFRWRDEPARSPAELLRRVRVLEVDFDFTPSQREAQGLEWCGDALSDRRRGQELWDRLLRVVSESRTAGGMLAWARLWTQVGDLGLRVRPAYEGDLEALAERSGRNLAAVSDTIAGGVHIRRESDLQTLASAAEDGRFVVLAGPSGVGKTALARTWARDVAPVKTVVWLRADEVPFLVERGPSAALEHPLLDVLAAAPRPGWLIVDGLDRAFDERVLASAADLVRSVRDAESVPFGVLLTAQHQEWRRLSDHFAAANAAAPWRQLLVGPFDDAQLKPLYEAYPDLQGTVARNRLGGALRNAKVLDVITRRLAEGEPIDPSDVHSGEASVAAWFVERLGGGSGADRLSRTRAVLALAQRHGDRLEPATALPQLPDSCAEHVDAFVRDGVCVVEGGKVAFAHDLYGDWARYEVLGAHKEELPVFLAERRESPLWDRAIRLYATGLLEAEGSDRWRSELERIAPPGTEFVHDLFVEAALFATDPARALERLWPELEADEGRLLRRLVRRFLHVGTLPNQAFVAGMTAIDPSLAAHAATRERFPHWPLWPPLLAVLHRHAESAVALAGADVAAVAALWLRWTPTEWPLRSAAADLALAHGEQVLGYKREGLWGADEMQKAAWRAALAAVPERPAAVRAMAMTLCGKSADPQESGEVVDSDDDVDEEEEGRPGPPGRDRYFRDVCLDTDALHPVIEHDSRLAADVLVALLEPAPRRRNPHGGWASIQEKLGMDRIHGWFTPSYLHGPFLVFLRTAPDEALDMALRVVQGATRRWAEEREWEADARLWPAEDDDEASYPPAGPDAVELVDGDTVLRREGDGELMVWHRGGGRVPTTLASLLMAVEKWVYDERDAGKDIGPVCGRLLRESSSMAMVGLLASVACRHPELLSGSLRPLVTSWGVLLWDRTSKLVPHWEWRFGLFNEPDFLRKVITEWHELEHRAVTLEQRALGQLLSAPGDRAFYDAQRERWLRDVGDEGEPTPVRMLAARLDRANWQEATDEQGRACLEFVAPTDLAAESAAVQEEIAERQFWTSMPMQCREVIDGERELPTESLEETWHHVMKRLTAGPPTDVTEHDGTAGDNAACGLAAMLVLRHRAWLTEHPEREAWCTETLVRAAGAPRTKSILDSAVGGTPWQWDSFCADALPTLWVDRQSDPALRRAVAQTAQRMRHNTVRRLFHSAAAVRDALGEDFGRLRHLAVHIAQERPTEHIRVREDEAAAALARGTLDARVSEFMDGSLAPTVPPWAVLAVPPGPRLRMNRGVDESYLYAAHAWIPSLRDARSESERDEWLVFFTEALASLTRRLARDVDERGETRGTPYEHEYSLLRALPQRILELPGPLGRRLWEPVLQMGPSAHYWVTTFLDAWFDTGLATAPPPPGFVERWEEMIAFAGSTDWWAGREGYHRRELRWSLLGMGRSPAKNWSPDQAPLIERMKPHLRAWAAEDLNDPHAAIQLAHFLAVDAAIPVLSEGLVWLTGVEPRYDRDRYEKALESLVAELYARTPQLARRQDGGGEAFRRHVRRLAERQSAIALEILSRLS